MFSEKPGTNCRLWQISCMSYPWRVFCTLGYIYSRELIFCMVCLTSWNLGKSGRINLSNLCRRDYICSQINLGQLMPNATEDFLYGKIFFLGQIWIHSFDLQQVSCTPVSTYLVKFFSIWCGQLCRRWNESTDNKNKSNRLSKYKLLFEVIHEW